MSGNKTKPPTRFELATPALREQCSNHWATVAMLPIKRKTLYFRSIALLFQSMNILFDMIKDCSSSFYSYLSQCRLFSVSMENFVKFIKHTISKISPDISLDDAREELLSECDRYFEEVRQIFNRSSCFFWHPRRKVILFFFRFRVFQWVFWNYLVTFWPLSSHI